MSGFLYVEGEQSAVTDWLSDHGLNPNDILRTVEFLDDGTLAFRRTLRGDDGTPIVVAAHTCQHCGRSDPDDLEVASELVAVEPKRPFPVSP